MLSPNWDYKGEIMAKLAYCETCKATYPLAVVNGTGTRSKNKELTCPMGHVEVREVDTAP